MIRQAHERGVEANECGCLEDIIGAADCPGRSADTSQRAPAFDGGKFT
jgi:hypothetical protein